MNIYISGLEFPKVPTVIILLPDGKVEIPSQARIEKAMPVSEHGRLIDADALDADLEKQDMKTGEWDAIGFSISEIDNAPTIIPADEE